MKVLALMILAGLGGFARGQLSFDSLLELNKKFGDSISAAFSDFMVSFNRSYSSPSEAEFRSLVFEENLREIEKVEGRGNLTYHVGINDFSDLTWEEFELSRLMREVAEDPVESKARRGRKLQVDPFWGGPTGFFNPPRSQFGGFDGFGGFGDFGGFGGFEAPPPARFVADETTPSVNISKLKRQISYKSRATSVKNQLKCAACYAFAAITAVEIALSLKENQSLSAQEIVDCSYDDNGCIGGNPITSLNYMRDHGISLESSYKFLTEKRTCQNQNHQKYRIPFKMTRVPPKIPQILLALQKGPVAVLHISNKRLKAYTGGIFSDPDCKGTINHSATIIGYDLDAPVPYFELKNAWGVAWGEKGFYRMAIGPLNDSNPGMCRMLDTKSLMQVTA